MKIPNSTPSLLIVLLTLSTIMLGQDFEYEDNKFSDIIKARQITQSISYEITYEDDTVKSEELSSIENFNANGLVLESLDFYQGDTSTRMLYYYSPGGVLDSIYWYWYDFPSSPDLEIIKYKRDDQKRILQECEYHLDSGKQIVLDSCMNYLYHNNGISLITKNNGDTLRYFKLIGKCNTEFNSNGIKKSKYCKTSLEFYSSGYHYKYKNDKNGNLVETKITDQNTGEVYYSNTKYANDLPLSYTVYKTDGSRDYTFEHKYYTHESEPNKE